jgi:hypothetical protein
LGLQLKPRKNQLSGRASNTCSVALLVTADDVSLSLTPYPGASMGEIKRP